MAEGSVTIPKRRGRPRTNLATGSISLAGSTSDLDNQPMTDHSGEGNPVKVTLTQASPEGPEVDLEPPSRPESNRSSDVDLGDLFANLEAPSDPPLLDQRITTPVNQLPLTMPRFETLDLGPPAGGTNPPLSRGRPRGSTKTNTTKVPTRVLPNLEDNGGGLGGYNLRERTTLRRPPPEPQPVIPRRQDYPIDLDYRDPPRLRVISPSMEDLRISEPEHRHPNPVLRTLLSCNLRFAGKPGEDVEAFLFRVDQTQIVTGATDQEILSALSFCLHGEALTWFMAHTEEFVNWAVTRKAFRDSFSDPDYQRALREEIDRRTQGSSESVRNYVSCMRGLFQRTNPPWPELERASYTIRNLLPLYQRAMPVKNFPTMRAVEDEALRQESITKGAQIRRPPPRPELSLCPGFAYHSTRNVTFAPSRPSHQNDVQALFEEENLYDWANDSPSSSGGNEVECWNCDTRGHIHRDCQEPRRRFCYRCRRPGVTTASCTYCNPGYTK